MKCYREFHCVVGFTGMGVLRRFGWTLPQVFTVMVAGVVSGLYIWLPYRDEYLKIHNEERLKRIQERQAAAEAEKTD